MGSPPVGSIPGFAEGVPSPSSTIGLGILCYEGRGNTQFGFRYAIDLLPAAFVAFAFSFRRFTPAMLAACVFSALVNLYGLLVWKELPRFRA